MGEAALLITAIGGLVTSIAGAIVLLVNTFKKSRKEREDAADQAVDEVVKELSTDPLIQELLRKRIRDAGDNDDRS